MKIKLLQLDVRTKHTTETVVFAPNVTFIYGPVGTGKSTVAHLIDFCFGGRLEQTPAIQKEFLSAQLSVQLGEHVCTLERALVDTQSVRVSWSRDDEEHGSVNAPLQADDVPLIDAEVYNLSDLVFYLCGVTPIMVRKSKRDPNAPLVRLGFRDLLWYCYLEQDELDSSFFQMEHPFKGLKSRDAMRFITGLHSERLNQLDIELYSTIDEQRSKREAVKQIRKFMDRFQLGAELDIASQIQSVRGKLGAIEARQEELEETRHSETHQVDTLRDQLRGLSQDIEQLQMATHDGSAVIDEQVALRDELVTAKTKALRAEQAGKVLEGTIFVRCPQCGADLSARPGDTDACRLCRTVASAHQDAPALETEALRRDVNERIDELTGSISRRKAELERTRRLLRQTIERKAQLDDQLADELNRYDSAFVSNIRALDREAATLQERLASLARLRELPEAITSLEEEAGALQGRIDRTRSAIEGERERLRQADRSIQAISARFHEIMLAVRFPNVYEDDEVELVPRNWQPLIRHGEQEWGFFDAGSGGKKTLFNVCYALAVHSVARDAGLPLPSFLIVDSPTKNISEDENPELVQALYCEIYRQAQLEADPPLQFLLIDSDIVRPENELAGFQERRMAGDPDAPKLISDYEGP